METLKTCKLCNEAKTLDLFFKSRECTFGRESWCKVCKKILYPRNKELANEQRRKRRQDPEYLLKEQQYNKKLTLKNLDKIRERRRRYQKANREKIRENRKIRRANPENLKIERDKEKARLKLHADYYKEKRRIDSERLSKNKNRWKAKNNGRINALTAKRYAAKMQRTPKWLTKEHLEEIKQFYIDAIELAWLNQDGSIFHVDHIVPMQGENVSGLHVPWNLQLLPESMNLSKGNKFNGA